MKQYSVDATTSTDAAFFSAKQSNVSDYPQQAPSAKRSHGNHFSSGERSFSNRGGYRGGKHKRKFPKNDYRGVACDFCHKHNQSSAICRKELQSEKFKQESSQSNPSDFSYMSSFCLSGRRPFDWCAGSGATAHMTDKLSCVTIFSPITPET